MRTDAFMKYAYTYEYWRPIFTPGPGVGEVILNYEFDSMRTGNIGSRGGGYYLISREQMDIDGEIRNVRDADGNEIFVLDDSPYYMFVSSVEANFDALGRLIGWRHGLSRSSE